MKQRIPNATYSKEFREQAVKKGTEEGLDPKEAAKRLSLPPFTPHQALHMHDSSKIGTCAKLLRSNGG